MTALATHNLTINSSHAEILIISDCFDLEHCCQHSESRTGVAALDDMSLLPPPEKFVGGTRTKQGNIMSRTKMLLHHQSTCRSVGESIVCEESAHWACEGDERERAVKGAACLITAFVVAA